MWIHIKTIETRHQWNNNGNTMDDSENIQK